jgi:DNA-binding transcriptional LysR family regulator
MAENGDETSLSWDLIRAFLALERYGDYEVAAERVHIDDSTMRRRIRMVEQFAGRTLFVRGNGCWKVSPDQHELVKAALRMEEAARCFSREHKEGAGHVRITVLDVFAQRFSQVFAELTAKHPRLTLNVTTETHFVNLEQEQVDIAIRLAQPVRKAGSLRIKRIGEVYHNAYASRKYLDRMNGEARSPDFASHRMLAMNLEFSHDDHNFIFAHLNWENFGLRGRVTTWSDSFFVLARMCEAGFGVAILPTIIATDCQDVQIIHPKHPGVVTELWMVSRFDLRAAWQRDLATLLREEVNRWPQ